MKDELVLQSRIKNSNDLQLQISDINGKVLIQDKIGKNINEHHVDMSKLAAGLYLIRLSNKEFTATEKVVKQ